jgi:hypothetical protein
LLTYLKTLDHLASLSLSRVPPLSLLLLVVSYCIVLLLCSCCVSCAMELAGGWVDHRSNAAVLNNPNLTTTAFVLDLVILHLSFRNKALKYTSAAVMI